MNVIFPDQCFNELERKGDSSAALFSYTCNRILLFEFEKIIIPNKTPFEKQARSSGGQICDFNEKRRGPKAEKL